jgi:hypothetical protein
MNITPERVELSDHDAAVSAQASRLMSDALEHSGARRIALVEEKDGSDIARLELPPATADGRFENPVQGTFNDSREFCGTLPDFSVLLSERRLQRLPHPSFKLV